MNCPRCGRVGYIVKGSRKDWYCYCGHVWTVKK